MYTVLVRHSVCSMKTSEVNVALRCCSITPSIPAATGTLGPHHYAQYLGNLDFASAQLLLGMNKLRIETLGRRKI